MAVWTASNIVLTKLGEAALSKAEAGLGQIEITRAACSSEWTDPSTTDLTEIQSLDEVQELLIVDRYSFLSYLWY